VKQLILFSSLLLVASAACTNGDKNKGGAGAKKLGPKNAKSLTSKPANGTDMGMGSSVTAPNDSSGKSLNVPGGSQVALVGWQDDVSGDGTQSSCIGAFTDDGSAVIGCAPLSGSCDDGSTESDEFYLAFDGSQNAGAFAVVGSNICSSGLDVVACGFDGDGNIGACGAGDISGSTIVVSQ
jgi:hypothetical protein